MTVLRYSSKRLVSGKSKDQQLPKGRSAGSPMWWHGQQVYEPGPCLWHRGNCSSGQTKPKAVPAGQAWPQDILPMLLPVSRFPPLSPVEGAIRSCTDSATTAKYTQREAYSHDSQTTMETPLYKRMASKSAPSPYFEPLIKRLYPKTKALKNHFQKTLALRPNILSLHASLTVMTGSWEEHQGAGAVLTG